MSSAKAIAETYCQDSNQHEPSAHIRVPSSPALRSQDSSPAVLSSCDRICRAHLREKSAGAAERYCHRRLTSAILYATAKLKTQTPIQLHTMTGGPPDSAPMIKTPERAVQQVTMLKLKPIMLRGLKLRLSSTRGLATRRQPNSAVRSTYLVGNPAFRVPHLLPRYYRMPCLAPLSFTTAADRKTALFSHLNKQTNEEEKKLKR